MFLAVAILCATQAPAAAFAPSQPVRAIIPFPPGGAADFTARLIAPKLSDAWRQPVIIENQAGANGNVGAQYVARSAPDGTVLLVSSPGVFTTNRFIYRAMSYNPDHDLAPVCLVIVAPNVLVVSPDSGIADLPSLLVRARAQPGELTYASQGIGSTAHLTGALMAHIPTSKHSTARGAHVWCIFAQRSAL